jgi:DNA repair protein RadC
MVPKYKLRMEIEKDFAGDEFPVIYNEGDADRIIRKLFDPTTEVVEVLYILYLDNAGKVIGGSEIARGAEGASNFSLPYILKSALTANAMKFILAHNHPSGSLTISASDKLITSRVFKAASIIGIELLDHIVIARENTISLKADYPDLFDFPLGRAMADSSSVE